MKKWRTLLAKRGLLTLRELASEIAGEKIKGSWWAHPKGKIIFNVASALEDEALVCTIKDDVITFVDDALVPSLLSLVHDKTWRASRMRGLPAPSKRLLARVDEDEIEIVAKYKHAAKPLKDRLLAHAVTRHTDSGKHATYLSAWKKPRPKVPFETAVDELRARGASEHHLVRDLVKSSP